MKILVIDSGGRGHALVWKILQSPLVKKVYVAPGNGGTQKVAENVPIGVAETNKLFQFALKNGIDLTVASQDDSLAAGVVDEFQRHGLRIFGPTYCAAVIESSKEFSKRAMDRACVDTAGFKVFTDPAAAILYVRDQGAPIVVKASGLALGKGARVCMTIKEAEKAVDDFMVKRIHGDAGDAVVIEEYLEGPEASIHAWCDGKNFSLFPSARDHKPAFDDDRGPNTGGMGTIAPIPGFSPGMMHIVREKVVSRILEELAKRGTPFVGCLYPGLKITPQGFKVLEFNARPGDPEMQSYMRLLKTDIVEIMLACTEGVLSGLNVEWNSGYAACIVAASGGYPGDYKKGFPITGIEEAERIPGVVVFHAGTKMAEGKLVTSGGRVLGVSAIGSTPPDALRVAYQAMDYIKFQGKQLRHDIGAKSLGTAHLF